MSKHLSPQPNTLGNTSLGLGIGSAMLVFTTGLCAMLGIQQSWLATASVPLFICGGIGAFVGFIGMALGMAGLFAGGSNRSQATAAVGLVMGILGMCMFFFVMATLSQVVGK